MGEGRGSKGMGGREKERGVQGREEEQGKKERKMGEGRERVIEVLLFPLFIYPEYTMKYCELRH